MAKVIVGITGNEKEMPAMSGIKYITVARDLADGVKEAGGLPLVIPISDKSLAKDYLDMVDKLILSGGQHVDPRFYGESREITSTDYLLERDEFELALIEEALRQKKPIFAVCRGMQLLNVALGGTLRQEVSNHWQEDVFGTSHSLNIRPNSRISRLFQEGVQINSLHHQSIDRLAPGLIATAYDPRDGVIEAYEDTERSLIGIQWHPEFLRKKCPSSRELFRYVIHSL